MNGRHRPYGLGLVCAAVLVASMAAARAQTPPQEEANRFVVIGCIEAAKQGPPTITDFRGGKTATFRLDAEDERVKRHVGHTVEVHGPLARAADDQTPPRLTVQKLHPIAARCLDLGKPVPGASFR